MIVSGGTGFSLRLLENPLARRRVFPRIPCMRSQRGILLINLGSPDSPSVRDVRRYLAQFLMDPRVIDSPWIIRKLVVSLFILPFRPKKAAAAYASIWTPQGSPLIVISRQVEALLRQKIEHPVALGMSYGNPSIDSAVRELLRANVDEIFLIPMYPHYAMSTYETVVAAVEKTIRDLSPSTRFIAGPPFYDDGGYIEALVASASPYLEDGYDHLLFSYHGLPERHLRKSDPTRSHCLMSDTCCQTPSPAHATCYRHQVLATTESFVARAGIARDKYSVAFQSRLGRDPWLQPYTDEAIAKLAESGVKKLLVICPSFVADCLETLEEIGIEAKAEFLEHGGGEFVLVPCLNDHPSWIEALAKWCDQ
jgi:ferrochelatase